MVRAIYDWIDSMFYQLQHIKEAERDQFIHSECMRIQEAAAANHRKNQAITAAKRSAQRQSRADGLATEKELCSQKVPAAKSLLATKKAKISKEKAAEKARITDEKAAKKEQVAIAKAQKIALMKEEKAKIKALAAKEKL
ncbi:hypothetical protein PCANC_25111 [Puccinia coronata f. sp. avenae]|uniref:Uncharacterized protein n=1 Tax=Puccinia coronata f. sp. avenae TaxID=200324 RepID=A0A2N5TSP9_9BASI|nr:hypothetical protein PCANC_25111 [Puccinia coronata f. sp. avenae]